MIDKIIGGTKIRVGTKKYRLQYCLKRWWQKNFFKYNTVNNRQCSFGIRCSSYKGNKCLNRFNPITCGECWRADRLKLKKPLRDDINWE